MQRITRYIFQKFLWNFVLFSSMIALVAWLFEVVTRKKPDSFTHGEFFYEVLLKVPFVLHKGLFFIIFVVTCFSLWGLVRWRENIAMSSSGFSLWQMVSPVFVLTFFFCMVDLFYVDPLSQSLLFKTKITSSHGQIMHSEKGWRRVHVPDGSILFYFSPQGESAWYFFSSDGQFLRQFYAKKYHTDEEHIILKDVWALYPQKTPQKLEELTLKKPYNFSHKDFSVHPAFMSFTEIISHFLSYDISGRNMYVKFFYLLSTICTILFCVFFAAGIVMGHSPYKRRLIGVCMGGVLCFFFYLFQEYIYLIALSRSYSFPIGLFGITPLGMFGAAVILWTEKNQW